MIKVTETDWTTNPPTVIERDLTADELAQIEKDRQEEIEREQSRLADIEAKTVQRQAILNRLGLTEEEAKLLLS